MEEFKIPNHERNNVILLGIFTSQLALILQEMIEYMVGMTSWTVLQQPYLILECKPQDVHEMVMNFRGCHASVSLVFICVLED